MTVDVKQTLEKIMMNELVEGVSPITDVIDYLSEKKIVSTSKRTITRWTDKDANVLTNADKYGEMALAHSANYEDRTFIKDEYPIPTSDGISFVIPRDALDLFGITPEHVTSGKQISAPQMEAVGTAFLPEIVKLVRKVKKVRRAQVRELLSELQAPTKASQKPLGLAPVALAGARTGGQWGYTNKLAVALDKASYSTAVNILASAQKNIYDEEYMISKPLMLLHASDFSKAEEIMLPHLAINILQRTHGDSILPETLNMKMSGTYGDTGNSADWILLGENHEIYRMAVVSPLNQKTNGLSVSIEWIPMTEANKANKQAGLRLTVYDRSFMVVDSALDIVKSVNA